jgi:hypothetical protein
VSKETWCFLMALRLGGFGSPSLQANVADCPLTKLLAGRRFTTDTNTKQSVTSTLQTLDTDFVYAGLGTLVLWCDKCLNISGDYAEVWCVACATHVPLIRTAKSESNSQHQVLYSLFFGTFLYFQMAYHKWSYHDFIADFDVVV